MLDVSSHNCHSLDVLDGDDLGSAGEPVDGSEEVLVAPGLRERSHKVDMYMIKSSGQCREGLEQRFHMGLYL